MDISDIVRRVRDSAGDVAVLQFTNVTITDWINDAIRECVLSNDLLQARASSSTVVDQEEYSLPTDIFKVHSVTVDGLKLQVLTLQEWEELHASEAGANNPEGQPFSCYIYAGILHLWPVPDSVETLVINYTQLPTAVTYTADPESWNPTSPDIPEHFHNRLVTYCLAQVAFQDDMYEKYNALMNEFRTDVKDLGNLKDEQQDLYPFISVASRDMGEWPYDEGSYF